MVGIGNGPSDTIRPARQVRIVHVLGVLFRGGNQTLCSNLIDLAPTDTYHHTVLVLDGSRRDLEGAFSQRCEVLFLDTGKEGERNRKIFWHCIRVFREWKPDVVLAYGVGVHFFKCLLAARCAGVRRLRSRASSMPAAYPGIPDWKWRLLFLGYALVGGSIHPPSHSAEEAFRRIVKWLPKGSCVIANGCMDIGQSAARRDETGEDAKRRVIIGMVSRLDEIKDHATLLAAFDLLCRNMPDRDLQLWIVGDGPLMGRLREMTSRLPCGPKVAFLGNREDVATLLGEVDIFVFSGTSREAFGIAVIEAMMAGLPIVATAVPACREVLGEGEAGVLVAPGHPGSMAGAIQNLITDDQLRAALRSRARQRALKLYRIEECAKKWYDLLRWQ